MSTRTSLPYGYPIAVDFTTPNGLWSDTRLDEQKKTYGVMTTYTTPAYTQRIQYEMVVDYLYKEERSNLWQVKLDKSPVFINRAAPYRVIDCLQEEFMLQVLYPIVFWVDQWGEIIGIENYPAIFERFKKFKTQKQKEYTGLYMERYWQILERNIADPYTLQKALEKDWFITLFFTPLYAPKGYIGDTQRLLVYFPSPVAYERPIRYNGILRRNLEYVREYTMEMQFKVDNPQKNTDIVVDYQMNTRAFILSEIQAKTQLYHEQQVVKTVETTISHLREKSDFIYPEEKKQLSLYERFLEWLYR